MKDGPVLRDIIKKEEEEEEEEEINIKDKKKEDNKMNTEKGLDIEQTIKEEKTNQEEEEENTKESMSHYVQGENNKPDIALMMVMTLDN